MQYGYIDTIWILCRVVCLQWMMTLMLSFNHGWGGKMSTDGIKIHH